MNYYFRALRNYAVFSGRASRKEFWLFWLVHLIISVALALFEGFNNLFPESNESILTSVYALAVLLPTFAVGARRLHDTGRTGWWQLIAFIPLVGAIVLIIFCSQESHSGSNEYGQNPKGIDKEIDRPSREPTERLTQSNSNPAGKIILYSIGLVAILWVTLFVSGQQVLVWERTPEQNVARCEDEVTEINRKKAEEGKVGRVLSMCESEDPLIIMALKSYQWSCTYFNGRRFIEKWYPSSRSSCPNFRKNK